MEQKPVLNGRCI